MPLVITTVFTTHCFKNPGPDATWHNRVWALVLGFALLLGGARWAQAAAIEELALSYDDDGLALSAVIRMELGPAVEDALLRSVPVYFVAQADVYRERWYWSDKRVASASRTYRLAYQSLTRRWRLSMASGSGPGLQYALHQNHATLEEALATVTRLSSWTVAETAQVVADARHRLEFRFKLDMALLPRPFQLGLNGQTDWNVDLHQTVPVPPVPVPVAPVPATKTP